MEYRIRFLLGFPSNPLHMNFTQKSSEKYRFFFFWFPHQDSEKEYQKDYRILYTLQIKNQNDSEIFIKNTSCEAYFITFLS